MVFDWDDHCPDQNALLRLWKLHAIRPDFRCTLFAIPNLGSERFWNQHPDWVELAVHGWEHPDPMESAEWTVSDMRAVIDHKPSRFVNGFKAPGWQISDGCYEALAEASWWVADQPYNDSRRPPGLRVHLLGQPDHWHGHVQNVCSNGLEETWDEVVALVKAAPSFEFMSEAVRPWVPARVAA